MITGKTIIFFVLTICIYFCFTSLCLSSYAHAVNPNADVYKPKVVIKPDFKNIRILATGGTIAGTTDDKKLMSYTAAVLPVQELVDSVPSLTSLANISAQQFSQIASENMTPSIWLTLSKHVNDLLSNPDIDGVVITHGTDTLEETAYFLQLTVKSDKPVVIVGAMRPADGLSADGYLNLHNAVLVAASSKSIGKGALVVMDDIIVSGRDVSKTSTYHAGTFKGGEYGVIGTVQAGYVNYVYAPLKKHTANSAFDIKNTKELPSVNICYAYAGSGYKELDYAIKDGAKGVVLGCVGNGSLSNPLKKYIGDNSLDTPTSLPLVRSTRIPTGMVTPNWEVQDKEIHTISAYDLSPQKARILLMLCLSKGMTKTQIADAFMTH